MDWNKYRKELRGFTGSIIIYHKDADGVCSAALLNEYVNAEMAHPNDGPGISISNKLIDIINDYKSVIFVDLPVDQLNIIDKIKTEKIFILDHHPPQKNLANGNNIYHMNPRFEQKDTYQPASYLAYKLVEDELEELAWKSGVGIVGDHGVEDCKYIFVKIEKKYPNIFNGKKITQENIFASSLGKISRIIDSSKVINGLSGIKESFDILLESDCPDSVFNSKLMRYYTKFKEIMEEEKRLFQKKALKFQKTNSFLYEVDTNYSINSSLSTTLADENPDAAIYVYQKNNGLKISARCQTGRLNVAEILKEAVSDYGNAGGHPQAAGGYVKKGKENIVLNRLKEIFDSI